MQEIFVALSNGYMTYVLGVNFLIYVASAVFCTSKMLQGFEQIMYAVPLSIGIFHMGIICNKSHSLMDEVS